MSKKKGNIIYVHLKSSESNYRYTTHKNTKSENTAGKMKFRKYDPIVRKHVEFNETKIG